MDNTQKQKTTELRRQGLGFSEIARKLNSSRNTVKSFCNRNKLWDFPKTQTDAESAANRSFKLTEGKREYSAIMSAERSDGKCINLCCTLDGCEQLTNFVTGCVGYDC